MSTGILYYSLGPSGVSDVRQVNVDGSPSVSSTFSVLSDSHSVLHEFYQGYVDVGKLPITAAF